MSVMESEGLEAPADVREGDVIVSDGLRIHWM